MRQTDRRPRLPAAISGPPAAQGLYDPAYEHDACGIGFVADIAGRRSRAIVAQALTVLENLAHRGAVGCEPNTGDGAGILLQVPHGFLSAVTGFDLPPPGDYAVGLLFLPREHVVRRWCRAQFETIAAAAGQPVIGWRALPTNNDGLGHTALASEPAMVQVFLRRAADVVDPLDFERRLLLIRRRAERAIRPRCPAFTVPSLSARTLVYKGMLQARQLRGYFPDLEDDRLESALALVHARFSTNTFPSWARAHPNRYLIHNGEINTLRGNANWMRAREALLASDVFGPELVELLPIIDPDGSDSAMFDNVLELLVLSGRSLPHALMMMVPEPWSQHTSMDPARRDFYAYHSCLMEPWDGPAALAFTDGTLIGAALDRNGLRPARYLVTHDGLAVLASETGVLEIAPERVARKGRLQPGRFFLVDTAAGRVLDDDEVKGKLAGAAPYGAWLAKHRLTLADLPAPVSRPAPPELPLTQRQRAFGYSYEDLRLILAPMLEKGVEALGSMGDDTPPAALSDLPRPLYDYFKQLFAQVTNPPIDAIREALITGTETWLGSEGNLLAPTPRACRRIQLPHPLLTDRELARLAALDRRGFRAATLPILFPVHPENAGGDDAPGGLAAALDALFNAADAAIADGHNLLVLTDRGLSRRWAPIPALLAISGLHHHLIRAGSRARVSLILESGEPREVHHLAVLLGYGCDAVNPYLALETVADLARTSPAAAGIDPQTAQAHYLKAAVKGIVKVMSKMGISTVQSYRGAQIFEALGLDERLIDRYFTGTASRIGGLDLAAVAAETARRHRAAFPPRPANGHTLEAGGKYQVREGGEFHLFNPATVHLLQQAVRDDDGNAYRRYADAVTEREARFATLRGLMALRPAPEPLPLDEVEPAEAILRRFKTGAMSYGSISQEAHEALAIAMNRIGGKSNTGEGGEDPARYRLGPNGDSRNSAIKQVASGRFGVTSEYLVNATEIQIKMAQGAKPGEGGQLPGHKVYPWIARVRFATPGVGLISPPPHHDIYSIEDLAQLIHDLKNANPAARISVKLVSEVGVGTVAAGVAKGHADVILISGSDGGTGASPQTSIKHAGLPWELGLAETHQTLLLNGLRDRVVLETDGQLRTGRDVIVAALLGAEEFGFATAPLVALGCIMMRVCHLNTCPVGVATQDPALRDRFAGNPEHVVRFMRFVAEDVRRWLALLGFRTLEEAVGQVERLEMGPAIDHWKARGLDLSRILHQVDLPAGAGHTYRVPQDHGLERTLDRQLLLDLCRPALERGESVEAMLSLRNIHRVVGTQLGSAVTRRYGAAGLPEDTIRLHFLGSAGQSFGAFVPRGIRLTVEGDANDYLGKGLSGGKIILFPPASAGFEPAENTITGNVAFYGATGGEAYLYGAAGERFCVRNSGLVAVVEAVGDHGCEYMTGGRVIVLGPTGRNFAAGMSGGLAYVLDRDGRFASRCNTSMVSLGPVDVPDEIAWLQEHIRRHQRYTGSKTAAQILGDWERWLPRFVRVLPDDYGRVLEAQRAAEASGLSGEEAVMAAFEANKRDLARIGGE